MSISEIMIESRILEKHNSDLVSLPASCVLHSILLMLLVSIICLPVLTADAQESNNNPFVIKSIEVKGSKTMPPETVLGILQTRTGEEVSLSLIREDVKELYKLGQFSKIEVESSGSKDGIVLTFVMEEWPKVKNISLEGNEEISDNKLKDALTIGSGRSLSGKLLDENKKKIVSLYQKKGYYLVQVDAEITEESPESVNLLFRIEEGSKVKVKDIEIIGNRRMSNREIRKQMKTKKGKKFDDSYFGGDLQSIANHYRENGFINAKVINSEKEYNAEKTELTLRVEIEEGPQFRIGQLGASVQAHENDEQLFTEREILKQFGMKEGDIFSRIPLDEAVSKVTKMYFDKGRVFVQVRDKKQYNTPDEVVDLALEISEGGLAYIDSVPINWISETIDEPHKTKEYVIRRELTRYDIKSGELFSSSNIEDARRKILTLGPFMRRAQPRPALSPNTNAESKNRKVTVNFDVEESRQSGMFSIAGGYGSEGGVFGALDIWDDNIFGRAWRLHLRGEIGTEERRTGQITFSTPWVFNNPISLGFSLYSTRRTTRYYPGEEDDTAIYRDESVGASVTLGRPLTRKTDIAVQLRNESVSYEELLGDPAVWEEIYKGKTRSVKLIADRDTRQFVTSMFDPNSGSYNTISAEFSGLGGDLFQKYVAESSVFIPTWWKLVLVFHMRTGYLTGEYPTVELLRYERFYLGGIDSVRGYSDFSIVPPDKYQEYGGNQMALLNIEYRFPITDVLRGLLFFDAGQTWGDNQWPWDNFKPRKSIGIGLRIDLFGALARLEYGYPLDEAIKGAGVKSGRFHFDIGPAF